METKERCGYEPDYAVPPGETLQEIIDSPGMTQRQLAARTGLTVQTVVRIIKGKQPITYTTANLLELATAVPARLWNNREVQCRGCLAKLDERERMRADLDWLDGIPVRELQARNLIGRHTDKVSVLRDTLAFYGVSSVAVWEEIWESPEVAERRSMCFETCTGPATAWIRQGELIAQRIPCAPYSRAVFMESLKKIRSLIVEKPAVFCPELVQCCAKAGVAVVFVPEMKKAPWNGATKWLTSDKAMILLSLRGKGEDRFWFSFFHEAGHVVRQHRKRELFINDGTPKDDWEKEADAFAAEFLIPAEYNPKIRALHNKADVCSMAGVPGVSSGIVAGRFQFLVGKWNQFKELIRTFDWSSERRPTTGKA